MSKTSRKPTLSANWPLERCEPEAVGLCPRRLGRISDLIRRYVDEGRVAGVITLVTRRGRIAHLECAGVMDLETRKPLREDAIFRIYSMSKIVTGAAALMLMEEGWFLPIEPVHRFLPEFKDLRVAVQGADGKEELVRPRRDVTIHDLFTHLSGLTYEYMQDLRLPGADLKTVVPDLCKRPIHQHPGEKWTYGMSTDVLGRLIEVVSGMTFDAFLQKRVFAPLGMTDTDFWVPPAKAERLAWMYTTDDAGKLVSAEDRATSPYLKRPAFLSGGGGMVSTTSDYLRVALMLLNKGAFGDVRLLGRKTVELMTADHLPPNHPPVDANDRGFGLGVSVLRRLGETRQVGSVGEFGWGGAACTQTWIDPAEDMITMIMLQHRPKDKFPLMDLFKQSAYQAIVD